MTLQVGEFVEVEGFDLGLGKIAELGRLEAEVSYFASPASGEVRRDRVKLNQLRPITLSAQTRVYWFDTGRNAWCVGRVAEGGRISGRDLGMKEDLYFVELPNRQTARVPISRLQVRWDRPVNDPIAYLAARTTETPFWHIGRRAFLQHVVEQRARCGSLTGLWSASLDLTPHQVRVVQAVLTDPVQRYLLADEVGLGKTIEAGAILRQYVLDEPNSHSALIVVPPHLVNQWTEELKGRFYLGPHLGGSIHIVSSMDPLVSRLRSSDVGMLILDEAHHLASMAFCADPQQRSRYGNISDLARRTPRLLLLSATPVLHNEEGFLAMLHLLEPEAYPLHDVESFRGRVASRQEIAESLSDLQPDAPSFFVEEALERLEPRTTGDAQAETLLARVRDVLENDEDDVERQSALNDLREHISEVYRLHRRLIRHRRDTLPDVLHGRSGADVLEVRDLSRRRLGELLEEWREQAHLSGTAATPELETVARLYWLLLRAAFSHPLVLREIVTARRTGRLPAQDLTPVPMPDPEILHYPEAFPGETDLLDSILRVSGCDAFPRLDAIISAVKHGLENRLKTVLFVDAPGVAERLAAAMSARLGERVQRYSPGMDLTPFLDIDSPIDALVCDRRAEEGLNLQRTRAQVLHLDLPLDLGRLEQRMGRIDRYGAKVKARSLVFAGDDRISEGWRACVQDVIRIFDRSVASLQYALEEHLRWLRDNVFISGDEAIQELVGRLTSPASGLEAELKRIRTQELLDSMAQPTEAEAEGFKSLDEFDMDCEEFQEGFEEWVVKRLQFRREQHDGLGLQRYGYVLNGGKRTLISPEQFLRYCRASVDSGTRSLATHELTFSRTRAARRGAQLARIGHPFVDGLVEHARRDDRGVSYVLWRLRPGLQLPSDPWLIFGFDYLVEADLDAFTLPEALAAQVDKAAVRRRLDALLPPRYVTQWVDQELEPIEDPALLDILDEPYRKRFPGNLRDYNLSAIRWEVVRPLIQIGQWEELCYSAAAQALVMLRERLSLDDALRRAETRLDEGLSRVRLQLEARLSRLGSGHGASELAALELEKAIAAGCRKAVRSPRLTPDSAFAMFLSTVNPFGAEQP